MIDSKTGKRITVDIDEKYGPYFFVSNYQDGGSLGDLFDDIYEILYWRRALNDLPDGSEGGYRLSFGRLADPVRLQEILDEIEPVEVDGVPRVKIKGVLLE